MLETKYNKLKPKRLSWACYNDVNSSTYYLKEKERKMVFLTVFSKVAEMGTCGDPLCLEMVDFG